MHVCMYVCIDLFIDLVAYLFVCRNVYMYPCMPRRVQRSLTRYKNITGTTLTTFLAAKYPIWSFQARCVPYTAADLHNLLYGFTSLLVHTEL